MKEGISLDLERECRNCLYRKTGWICTNAKSQYFQQGIGSEHTCNYFEASKAEAHFIRAMSTTMFMLRTENLREKEEYAREIFENYSIAIATGLPAEDEVAAKIGIATSCAEIVSQRIKANNNFVALESEEMSRMMANLREAGILDKKLQKSEIAGIWFQLAYIDLALDLKAAIIARDESQLASERFVVQHLSAVEHIRLTSLPRLTFRLAKNCKTQGRADEAIRNLENIRQSISRAESRFVPNVAKLRNEIDDILRQMTTTSAGSGDSGRSSHNVSQKTGCFIATAAYGSELAPQVRVLSQFRDNILTHSPAGRFFIKFYYQVSPTLARVIVPSEILRSLTRTLLISPLVYLLQSKAQKDGKNHQ